MSIKILIGFYSLFLLIIIAIANQGDYIYLLKGWVALVPYGDKWGHFLLMGLLSFMVNISLKGHKYRIFSVPCLMGSLIVAFVVTLEEISQIFVMLILVEDLKSPQEEN